MNVLRKTSLGTLQKQKKGEGAVAMYPLHTENFLSVSFLSFPYGGDVTSVYGRF